MKSLQRLSLIALILLTVSCGDDGPTPYEYQSDKCSGGDQATLTLNIDGLGNFTYTESSSAISHARFTDGNLFDALVMYMHWKDLSTGDSILFEMTLVSEPFEEGWYSGDIASFNGSVNFYIYSSGVLQSHYSNTNWQTLINELEIYTTTSPGGDFTLTQLGYVNASTSGILRLEGEGTTHAFTSSYTICPRY